MGVGSRHFLYEEASDPIPIVTQTSTGPRQSPTAMATEGGGSRPRLRIAQLLVDGQVVLGHADRRKIPDDVLAAVMWPTGEDVGQAGSQISALSHGTSDQWRGDDF